MTNIKENLNQLLKQAEQMDLKELEDLALNEPDKDKQEVLNMLFTYVLDKRQKEIINRQEFIR